MAWSSTPFLFSNTLSLTNHSEVPLEEEDFMCENLQSKDCSHFCRETALLIKTTLWVIPVSYLPKGFPSSLGDYSLWGARLAFSSGRYYIRLLK